MWSLLKPFVGPVALLALKEGLKVSGYQMSEFQGGFLVGFAVFWFVLALVSHRALFRRIPGIREWLPFIDPVGATSKELTARYIAQQTFAIADVALDGKIVGRTFEDCDIYGPAVLSFEGVYYIHGNTLDNEWALITVEQKGVRGPIQTIDTSFRNCRFHNVGIIGHKSLISKFTTGQQNT